MVLDSYIRDRKHLHHCKFSYNEAKSNNFVIQYTNRLAGLNTSFTLMLISTSFTDNKAVNRFLHVFFIEQESSCFISIVEWTFTFNNGFTIEINECPNVLLKNNKFYNTVSLHNIIMVS